MYICISNIIFLFYFLTTSFSALTLYVRDLKEETLRLYGVGKIEI